MGPVAYGEDHIDLVILLKQQEKISHPLLLKCEILEKSPKSRSLSIIRVPVGAKRANPRTGGG